MSGVVGGAEKRKADEDEAARLAEIMLKRRKATVAASSAASVSTVSTQAVSAAAAAANRSADATFESNLKFIEQLHAQPRSSSSSNSSSVSTGTRAAHSAGQLTYSSHANSGYHDNASGAGGSAAPTPYLRTAAGEKWQDHKLAEFDPEHNFCIFVGDLGNECTDEMLTTAFAKWPSFVRARVVKDALTQKNKGYGFVAFKAAGDFVAAMREMNGKYVGNRPVKLRKATFEKRVDQAAIARHQRQLKKAAQR